MDKAMYDKGMAIRRKVLGDAYVDAALKNVDDFNRPLQDLVTEYCWGGIWGREGLPRKTRSMLNLAMITILNRPHELRAHMRGALTNGVTKEEITRSSCRSRSMPACRPRSIPSASRAKSSRRWKEELRSPIRGGLSWISASLVSARWGSTWPAA